MDAPDDAPPAQGRAPVAERSPAVLPEQEVRRRRVIFIPGYDERGAQHYRRLIARELQRFARLWDAQVELPPEAEERPEVPSVSWTIRTVAGAARVETVYELMRWDDIVARDFAVPMPMRLIQGQVTLLYMFGSRLFPRFVRAAPWYALAWLYPFVVYLLCVALSCVGGWLLHRLLGSYGAPVVVSVLAAAALAFALCCLLMTALGRAGTYVVHLIDDGRSQRRYALKTDKALHARIDAFAARIVDAVREAGVDEVLVVGHSSGSFIAIDATARAFERDRGLGVKTPIALLTVGVTELLVALHPKAGWLRDRMARLAIEPRLFWAECVGLWDTLNFPNRDPIEELRLKLPEYRPNPTFRRTFVSKMLLQETCDRLEKGWKIFRFHFQFIMANEVKGPYDYFALVCGPWLTRSQFERTRKGAHMSPRLGKPKRPQARTPLEV